MARPWLYFNRGGGGGILGVLFIIITFIIIIIRGMFLLLSRIWGYIYLQRYYSFVMFIYLNYICGIVQVGLVIDLSFQCVVFLKFDPLCHMYVLCQVYVQVYKVLFVCLYSLGMFFTSDFKFMFRLSDVGEWTIVAI
jgi:hypothetical protein